MGDILLSYGGPHAGVIGDVAEVDSESGWGADMGGDVAESDFDFGFALLLILDVPLVPALVPVPAFLICY